MLDGSVAHRAVDVREGAEAVRELLPGLILEGVRVHGTDAQTARSQAFHECFGFARLVPRDVQRHGARRAAAQPVEDGDVVELVVEVVGHARLRVTAETRSSDSDSPARDLHLERLDLPQHGFHVDAALAELLGHACEPARVRLHGPLGLVHRLHARYLGNAIATPPSTGITAPVVLENRSLATANTAAATSAGSISFLSKVRCA